MQMLKSFVTGLAILLVLGLMTQAQEREQRRPEGPTLLPPGILARLDLTAEQKEKITKLEKEFQEKIAPAKKKLDEAMEQARQNQDRQKAQEAQEAFRKEVTPIHAAFGEQVGQLLTEEQRRRVDELSRQQRGGPPFDLARILGQLDLTGEQKEKVEKWMKEVGEKHESAKKKLEEAVEQAKQNQDRAKVRELLQAHEQEMAKLHEELLRQVQGVLTDEQKRKFAEVTQRRRPEGLPPGFGHILPPPLQEGLSLTPEQKVKVAKLQKDTEAKLKEILNEEQNKRLDELKKGAVLPERPRRE
jgi:predicted nucleotidyltransferase